MGSGKSSVGKRLSELLRCRFMDLDDYIESRAGRTIPEVFATEGEAAFRAMELEALGVIINEYGASACDPADSSDGYGNLVLALGGGTVMTPECAALVHEYTYCIYLQATVGTLMNNLAGEANGRPMLQSPGTKVSGCSSLHHAGSDETGSARANSDALRTRISNLMALRKSTYESVARMTIDTDRKSIDDIALLCTKALG